MRGVLFAILGPHVGYPDRFISRFLCVSKNTLENYLAIGHNGFPCTLFPYLSAFSTQ